MGDFVGGYCECENCLEVGELILLRGMEGSLTMVNIHFVMLFPNKVNCGIMG